MMWAIIKRNSRYLLWFGATMLMLWSGFLDVLWGKVFFSMYMIAVYFYIAVMNELNIAYEECLDLLK